MLQILKSKIYNKRPILWYLSIFFMIMAYQVESFPYDTALDEPTQNYYAIIAPAEIRSEHEYVVVLQTQNVSSTTKVKALIQLMQTEGADKKPLAGLIRQIDFTGDQKVDTIFNIPKGLEDDKYYLSVNLTIGEKTFNHIETLSLIKKEHLLLIQADKTLYKQGETIKFRALVLDPETRPRSNALVNFYLSDPKGNRIQQWLNVTVDSFGQFNEELKLSSNAMLGKYNIHMESNGEQRQYEIEVSEYVLPQFSVDIIVPKFITYEESKIPVVIEARYTHGKNVKGLANITLRHKYFYSSEESEFWPTFEPIQEVNIEKPINGKIEVEFDPVAQLRMRRENYDTAMEVHVTVVEQLTGKNISKTETFQITSRGVRFDLVSSAQELKPGLNFYGHLKLVTYDGQPVNDPKNPFEFGYRFDTETNFTEATSLPPHSVVPLRMKVPKNAKRLYVRALYKGMRFSLPVKYASYNREDVIQFVPLDPSNPNDRKVVEVGSDSKIHVTVETNHPVKTLNYLIVARGEILHTSQYENQQNETINHLVIPFKSSMKSGFNLLVYLFNQSSFIVESTSYAPSQQVLSSMKLSSSTNTTKTGENVTITAEAKPNTFVAVVGIDQSMILLRKPNYIDLDQFKSQSNEFGNQNRRYYGYFSDANEVFYHARLILRENVIKHYNTYLRNGVAEAAIQPEIMGVAMSLAAPRKKSKSLARNSFEQSLPKIALRKDFPETWLWDAKVTDNQTGKAEFNSKVPDTITSWVVHAFGVNNETGLTLPEKPVYLTVFNPFFIKTNLPYSIVQGEQTSIQVLVHNYLGNGSTVEVTLFNQQNEFVFIQPIVKNKNDKNENNLNEIDENDLDQEDPSYQVEELADQSQQTLQTFVPSDDVVSVSFPIKAKQVGYIRLSLIARTIDGTAGDKIEKLLLVKAEGQIQRFNKALLVTLDPRIINDFVTEVDIPIPSDAINGSRLVTVNAVGDVMGTSLSNLDDLLRMPYGCGEQNLALLVPNIAALDYLNKTSKLTSRLERKAITNLQQGYQRQLKYQRLDGGFSAFGEKDKNGSTWLTAFTLDSFLKAQQYISIDTNVLKKSIEFLLNHTSNEGTFTEDGFVYDKELMGGVDKQSKDALNAYVLIALIRASQAGLIKPEILQPTINSLEKLVDEIPDTVQKDQLSKNAFYGVSLLTYALHSVNSSRADKAFKILWLLRQENELQHIYFDKAKKPESPVSNRDRLYYYYLHQPNTHAVEATAYALLTATIRKDTTNGLKLLSWLISKQNRYGGMVSTQDTVLSLSAFSSFASFVYRPKSEVQVDFQSITNQTISSRPALKGQFNLNAQNSLVLHQSELGERGFESEMRSLKGIKISGKGNGIVVVQVSWQYNVAKKGDYQPFNISAKAKAIDLNGKRFKVVVCTKYQLENESNMAIVELNTPSGFVFDPESLDDLRQARTDIKRIDIAKEDTEASFYFDKITKEELCFEVNMYRNNPVSKIKPALVFVYDYYQKQNAARAYYRVKSANPCDLCETENCRLKCAK